MQQIISKVLLLMEQSVNPCGMRGKTPRKLLKNFRGFSFGSQKQFGYILEDMILKKRISASWFNKLYKGSILYDFFSVLFSTAI